jgi:polyketide biosynthesis acyl carrier protein
VTRDEVLSVVLGQLGKVLPDVRLDRVDPSQRMSDLGASSLDRMDVVVASQGELGIQVPASQFADVADIAGLVEVLHAHCGRQ